VSAASDVKAGESSQKTQKSADFGEKSRKKERETPEIT